MPRFVSNGGVWEAAQERVVDPNAPPGKEVYEGPDRAATEMIQEAGGQLGTHFTLDPELIQRARFLNFTSVEEYLKIYGYDKKKADEHYEKMKKKMLEECHKLPQPKPAIQPRSGGDNEAPGSSVPGRKGGFVLPSDAPSGAVKAA